MSHLKPQEAKMNSLKINIQKEMSHPKINTVKTKPDLKAVMIKTNMFMTSMKTFGLSRVKSLTERKC